MTTRTIWQMTSVVCLFCFFAPWAAAQGPSRTFRPPPEYVQIGKPDQAEGKRIMEEFRKKGLYLGNCYFEFELRVMPRRGEDRTVPARMWVGHNDQGPVARIEIQPGVVGQELRLLVQIGSSSTAWSWKPGGPADPAQLSNSAMFDGLADTGVAVFDLQMPFLYWPEYVFEGVSKVRGRPAHTFLMYPPADVAKAKPDLTGMRLYLDSQYNQPVQSEYLGSEGKTTKTMTLVELKKVGEQWIAKTLDLRDEATRNKSRCTVTGAAVDLDFMPTLFEPDMLKKLIQTPRIDQIQR